MGAPVASVASQDAEHQLETSHSDSTSRPGKHRALHKEKAEDTLLSRCKSNSGSRPRGERLEANGHPRNWQVAPALALFRVHLSSAFPPPLFCALTSFERQSAQQFTNVMWSRLGLTTGSFHLKVRVVRAQK